MKTEEDCKHNMKSTTMMTATMEKMMVKMMLAAAAALIHTYVAAYYQLLSITEASEAICSHKQTI